MFFALKKNTDSDHWVVGSPRSARRSIRAASKCNRWRPSVLATRLRCASRRFQVILCALCVKRRILVSNRSAN